MTSPDSQSEFMDLLQAHRGIVYKVAGSYSRSGSEREDLVQEICLQLWRAFPRYDRNRSFTTWMYRVALNVAISELRRPHRSEAGRFESLEEIHLEIPDTADDRGQRLEAMYALIGRLAPLDRALILLYLDDRDHADIAEVLGISETNVATKIGRIKQRLRGQMAAHTTGG